MASIDVKEIRVDSDEFYRFWGEHVKDLDGYCTCLLDNEAVNYDHHLVLEAFKWRKLKNEYYDTLKERRWS